MLASLASAEWGSTLPQVGILSVATWDRDRSHQARFDAVTGRHDVDSAAFYAAFEQIKPADRLYAILFTPRSGSTWLASVLGRTGVLGIPDEYLNPAFLPEVARVTHSRDPDGLLHMLKRTAKSDNGVFGLKTRSNDIEAFGEEVFLRVMGETTRMFNLWREDLVAQAISLWRAVSTDRYHWIKGSDAPPPNPSYNAGEIEYWLRHICQIENDNVELLARSKRPFISVSYESIIKSPGDIVALFCEAVGVAAPAMTPAERPDGGFQKIGTSEDALIAHRFRDDRAELIAATEAMRMVRHEPDGMLARLRSTGAVDRALALSPALEPSTGALPPGILSQRPELTFGANLDHEAVENDGESGTDFRGDRVPGGAGQERKVGCLNGAPFRYWRRARPI